MEAYQFGKLNLSKIPDSNWTDDEIKIILKYLQESSAIEATTGITAKWKIIKSKVQNLRSFFKLTNAWRKSTGAGYLDTKRAEVMQMSPQDQQHNEICGEINESRTNYNVSDTGDSSLLDEPRRIHSVSSVDAADSVFALTPTDFEVSYSSRVEVLDIKSNGMNNTPSTSLQSKRSKACIVKKAKEFVKKMQNVNCMQSSAAYLLALRSNRVVKTEMFRRKLEWERKKHEKEFELSEKKLELVAEWTRAQIDLKRRELELREKVIERDAKLRVLDMEKEERLRKFELEFKYKNEC